MAQDIRVRAGSTPAPASKKAVRCQILSRDSSAVKGHSLLPAEGRLFMPPKVGFFWHRFLALRSPVVLRLYILKESRSDRTTMANVAGRSLPN